MNFYLLLPQTHLQSHNEYKIICSPLHQTGWFLFYYFYLLLRVKFMNDLNLNLYFGSSSNKNLPWILFNVLSITYSRSVRLISESDIKSTTFQFFFEEFQNSDSDLLKCHSSSTKQMEVSFYYKLTKSDYIDAYNHLPILT